MQYPVSSIHACEMTTEQLMANHKAIRNKLEDLFIKYNNLWNEIDADENLYNEYRGILVAIAEEEQRWENELLDIEYELNCREQDAEYPYCNNLGECSCNEQYIPDAGEEFDF